MNILSLWQPADLQSKKCKVCKIRIVSITESIQCHRKKFVHYKCVGERKNANVLSAKVHCDSYVMQCRNYYRMGHKSNICAEKNSMENL